MLSLAGQHNYYKRRGGGRSRSRYFHFWLPGFIRGIIGGGEWNYYCHFCGGDCGRGNCIFPALPVHAKAKGIKEKENANYHEKRRIALSYGLRDGTVPGILELISVSRSMTSWAVPPE